MILRLSGLVLLLSIVLAAGEPASGDGLVITGAEQVPAAKLRAAIADDLVLWLARHPAAPREAWPVILAERVRAGYRTDGFRDVQVAAAQDGDRTALTIVEGRRWTCGELRLAGFGEHDALVRRALTEPRSALQSIDIDTLPDSSPALWRAGAAVDWQPGAGERLADQAITTLRDAGVAGATVTARLLPRDDGVADCEVACAIAGKPIRLGSVRITGLDQADAEALRRWLALEPDSAATATLAFTVARRLRDCGRHLNPGASWEDAPAPPTAEDLASPTADLEERHRLARQLGLDAVARKGRADLAITVRPRPGAVPPWQEAGREQACALAARESTLARLNAGGTDVVIEARRGERCELVVWSPRCGLALVRGAGGATGAAIAITRDGLAVGVAGHRPLLLRFPHVFLILAIATDAKDPTQSSFNVQFGASSTAKPMRVRLDMAPEAVATATLRVHPWQTAQDAWQGDALQRTVRTATSAWSIRLDPRSGISWRTEAVPASSATAAGLCWSAGLVDGAWRRMVEPVIAGAAPAATRPVGAAMAAGLDALVGISDQPDFDRFCRHAAGLARSGIADALADMLPALDREGFSIPDGDGRDLRVPPMILLPARICAWIETRLADRLPAQAWPRQLLRGTACVLINQKQLAIADLRQAAGDRDLGPMGLLAFAHGVRLIGLAPLARDLAERGIGRCTADALAAEARGLAGLAADLLPLAANVAEGAAAATTDDAQRALLLGFAAECRKPGDPAATWEQAARRSADLGAGDWLRRCFRDLLEPAASTH